VTRAAQRRLKGVTAIAVVMTAAFLPGFGAASPDAAIQARSFVGFAVAMSADGTTALVGAPGGAHGTGAVYVFHVSGAGSWSSIHTPTAVLTTGARTQQDFGVAVALSADGTTAFVGGGGAIYVFHVAAENAWASSSKPTARLKVAHVDLGPVLAVSSDGSTLVLGDPTYNSGAGGAYVFHVPSEGMWASSSTPAATLSNAGQDSYDKEVGASVAISGDGTTVLLSDARNQGGVGADLYNVSTEDAWTSSSTPTAVLSDGSGSFEGYPASVALSGDGTVALVGSLYVFHVAAEAAWASTSTPTATLYNADEVWEDYPGYAAALSADGRTVLSTAPGAESRRGAVDVFHVPGEGAWDSSSTPTAILTNSRRHVKDTLGYVAALSADGATVLAGAPGFYFGRAEVFHASHASSWESSSTPTAMLTVSALIPCVVPKLVGLTGCRRRLDAQGAALSPRERHHGRAVEVEERTRLPPEPQDRIAAPPRHAGQRQGREAAGGLVVVLRRDRTSLVGHCDAGPGLAHPPRVMLPGRVRAENPARARCVGPFLRERHDHVGLVRVAVANARHADAAQKPWTEPALGDPARLRAGLGGEDREDRAGRAGECNLPRDG
jgi:hypothetical protein